MKGINLPEYYKDDLQKPLTEEEKRKVDSFLSLINFRYIPNRVHPIDIIKNEHQALRDVLIRRLGQTGKKSEQAFNTIQDTSKKLISSLSARLHKTHSELNEIRLATPKTWADLIFTFGYLIGNGTVEIEDSFQGSGMQSLLMLETLYLIDKDYFQKFGWRQAAIWAIEEPESSLHTSMEAQVASYLSEISLDISSRLQIFSTTHSDLILQYSDKSLLVEQQNNLTKINGSYSIKDLIAKASSLGISRYSHPILFYPTTPIILVDGKYDKPFIEKALDILYKTRKMLVICLEDLDNSKTGGESDIINYLKNNKTIIRNRVASAPIFVILDWESKKKQALDKIASDSDNRLLVYTAPESDCNPNLDKSFHGFERFYSDRLINVADSKRPNIILKRTESIKSIQRDEYETIKKVLYEEIKENGLIEEDIKYIRKFLTNTLRDL